MVVPRYRIVWSTEAKKQIKEAYKFIKNDSPQNAKAVKDDIVGVVRKLILNPEFYPPDKYKLKNDGSYRAFEKHKYRVAYRVLDKEIRILRVRHTKMEPSKY